MLSNFICHNIFKLYTIKTLFRVNKRLHSTTSLLRRMERDCLEEVNERDRIVWVDGEFTSLDLDKGRIMEIACIVTTGHLKIVEESPNIIIHQTKEILDNMNEWCIENHGKSGLTQQCLESSVTLEQAEDQLLNFLKRLVPKGVCPIAGNSIYMDKLFLIKHMPRFAHYCHYRVIDVSSIREVAIRWLPKLMSHAPQKVKAHRALDDIRESIDELIYYKNSIFK